MSNDVSSLKDTIVPKSDQLNSEQLIAGPITITITTVKRGNTDDQPVVVGYQGDDGRPYKPCKTMRKVMIFAWGDDGREWVGRSMTLFADPEVKFGGVKVGGIRISHMSHIERDISVSLTATRGKKAPVTIRKLEEKPKAKTISVEEVTTIKRALMAEAEKGMSVLVAAWKSLDAEMRLAISPDGTCPAKLKEIAAKADMPPPDDVPTMDREPGSDDEF